MSDSLPTPNRVNRNWRLYVLVAILLLGLPVAVWMDLRSITENLLTRQAIALNAAMNSIRAYYGVNVVGRILASSVGKTEVSHLYDSIPGAIPIPATLSLEIGKTISEQQSNVSYRFVSDIPFKSRAAHVLDSFELNALARLRAKPDQLVSDASVDGLVSKVRVISPVMMAAVCVNCHNGHPQSTKHDWKVGDVRGIQEITIDQPVITGLGSFRYLPAYFLLLAVSGAGFIVMQRRQAVAMALLNDKLHEGNRFLSAVSAKVSKYLAPQIYLRIFSGQSDAVVRTERKKLTIFFSDIMDFTSTTESTQPEHLTALLNEYFTEMSEIALKHGGTIDKFIGDAILIFFGDPESKGEQEDARACLSMAIEMQARLAQLNAQWKERGVQKPFRVRMGINTGYCNVGNFGSDQRMDYTIIGAEANLAARLQAAAEPGRIVLSYETYALVRDRVSAHALDEIRMKGISRPVIPYMVDGGIGSGGSNMITLNENTLGFTMYLDVGSLAENDKDHARQVLQHAMKMLNQND
jgi:class 3 adenylate cyclase